MLQLRPNCECCNRDLPPESTEAVICSFECTFCRACAEGVLANRCPNCGGGVRIAAAQARGEARQVSGFDRTRLQTRGVRENGLNAD